MENIFHLLQTSAYTNIPPKLLTMTSICLLRYTSFLSGFHYEIQLKKKRTKSKHRLSIKNIFVSCVRQRNKWRSSSDMRINCFRDFNWEFNTRNASSRNRERCRTPEFEKKASNRVWRYRVYPGQRYYLQG